jgi:hypothetical protein
MIFKSIQPKDTAVQLVKEISRLRLCLMTGRCQNDFLPTARLEPLNRS